MDATHLPDTPHDGVELAARLGERADSVTRAVLEGAGVDPGSVTWHIEPDPGRLRLIASGPHLPALVRNRMAVRALDAIRDLRCGESRVTVSYHAA